MTKKINKEEIKQLNDRKENIISEGNRIDDQLLIHKANRDFIKVVGKILNQLTIAVEHIFVNSQLI